MTRDVSLVETVLMSLGTCLSLMGKKNEWHNVELFGFARKPAAHGSLGVF